MGFTLGGIRGRDTTSAKTSAKTTTPPAQTATPPTTPPAATTPATTPPATTPPLARTRPFPAKRGRARSPEATAVAEYTGLWGWDVVPGARLSRGVCTCARRDCLAPGDHPLPGAAPVPAGTPLDDVARAWARTPGAAVLLPAGRHFDVLDVTLAAGRRALVRLERMGLPLGPVTATPDGRAHFFVAPGAAEELPQLLYRTGWDDAELDLRCLGPGDHVTAPPSEVAGRGPVRWLRPPVLDGAGRPPVARLLLGTLAYVSHRSAAA